MGLELLGTGAGAGQGLEQLIAQRRADELMRQQALMHAMSAIGLREDRQARLGQQKAQADSLAESRRQTNQNRQSDINLRQLQALAPGTSLGQSSYERLTNPETGAAPPESFDMSPGTPSSLPSTNLSGLTPIQSPSQAIAPSYRFKGTAQQQQSAAGLASLDQSRQASMEQATERAQQAWEKMRLEGDNQVNRLALQKAANDLSQAKLENERQRTADAASKTPQPQFMKDKDGNWHAAIFDKGEFKEIPMPRGFVPTKAGPASSWDTIKGMLGFGGNSGPTNDPTDPNWGK